MLAEFDLNVMTYQVDWVLVRPDYLAQQQASKVRGPWRRRILVNVTVCLVFCQSLTTFICDLFAAVLSNPGNQKAPWHYNH
jgi:hypothetical protein